MSFLSHKINPTDENTVEVESSSCETDHMNTGNMTFGRTMAHDLLSMT